MASKRLFQGFLQIVSPPCFIPTKHVTCEGLFNNFLQLCVSASHSHSSGIHAIHVFSNIEPVLEASSMKSRLDNWPSLILFPTDRQRTVGTMKIISNVHIRLLFAEIWQHFGI